MTRVHSFTCGDVQCAVLHEGTSADTAEGLTARYPGRSAADISAALGAETSTSSLNTLYLHSRGRHILVDAGFGEEARPEMGQTAAALAEMGLSPADIDIIFLTHFHGDHIAGLFDADGEPVYSKARYMTTQAEWSEWMERWGADEDIMPGQQIQERMLSLRHKVLFVSPGAEIASGISVVDLKGHTLGHAGLLVESGGEKLFHAVDLLHQPFQFQQADWSFVFDSDAALATETRRRTLQRCADEQLLTLFYHLSFPGLGKVTRHGNAFQWHPLAE